MALNARQERFAAEYLVDLNATQAYIRAGYSPGGADRAAHKLLRNAEVQALIAAGQAARAAKTEVTQQWVLNVLTTNAARAQDEKQYAASTRAAELCGKHLGMFTERVDVTSGGQKIPFAAFAAIMGYTPGAEPEPESDAT